MHSNPTESLFPILQPAPLTGLARIAAEGEHTEDGHLIEFRTLQVRSVLNRTVSRRGLPIDLTINPYRGCEFGCRYCYARYTHTFFAPRLGGSGRDGAEGIAPAAASGTGGVNRPDAAEIDFHDPDTFERVIFMKQNVAWLLEQELRRVDPALEIALGTATDPYQPIERRAMITKSILEVFARKQGLKLGIVTKSRLIERDIDLLRRIARRNRLVVYITITTPDVALARQLEPRAPRPDLRLAAVRKLHEAGIATGVLCSPLLPGITDSEAAIDSMARHAAAAGANFFSANPLFLKPCSRPTYLSFVREHFPALVADYDRRFGAADFAAPPYRRQLARAVARACRRYGLRQRSRDVLLTRESDFRRGPLTGSGGAAGVLPNKKPPQRALLPMWQESLFG